MIRRFVAAPKSDDRQTRLQAKTLPVWAVVAASVAFGTYLGWLFCTEARNGTAYPYMHYLFDYANGISRRALEGEIVRHLVRLPLTEEGFARLTFTLEAIVLGLTLACLVVGLVRRRSRALLLVGSLLVSSPVGLKNVLYDHGRQDVFGLILILVLWLLLVSGWRRTAVWIFGISLVPLSLVADNQLLLYVPLGLLLTTVDWSADQLRLVPGGWLIIGLGAFALSLSFLLPAPHVTPAQYEAYLRTKSATPLGDGMPWFWVYRNTGENLQFSHHELNRLLASYWLRAPDILFTFAVTILAVAVVYRTLGERPQTQRRYLIGIGIIALGYLALYVLASDWSRWTGNLNCALWILGLFFLAQGGSQRRTPWISAVLWLVVAFQLPDRSPFGIVTPTYSRVSALLRTVDLALGIKLNPADPIYEDSDPTLLRYSQFWGAQTSAPVTLSYLRSLLGINAKVPHATIRFPVGSHAPVEPLLVSGLPGKQNFIYVYYAGRREIQICYESEGQGGPLSAPLATDPAATHELTVVNGADLPVPGDRFWRGTSPEDIAAVRARMTVILDGQPVLDSHNPPHPSRGLFYWGRSPAESPFGDRFSGEIIRRNPVLAHRQPVAARDDPHAFGPVELTVKAMRFGPGSVQPLLSLGYAHEDAAMVGVARIDGRHFTLTYREPGQAAQTSTPFEADDAKPHRVTIRLPELYPPAESALWAETVGKAAEPRRLPQARLDWDGHPVLYPSSDGKSASPASVVAGANAVGIAGVAPEFDGTISALHRLGWTD